MCRPGADRLCLALRLDVLRVVVLDRPPCRLVRLLPDEDPVDRRGRLQTRRGVDDVAGDHALALGRTRGEADDRLPRVDPDPHLESVLLVRGPGADRKRGAHGTLRVVLVRDGRSEDGHHRVADELLHGAAVPLQLPSQPPVVAREHGAHVLRVELLGAAREADEIGEEHGHDLALLAGLPCLLAERGRARGTEAEAVRALGATVRADQHAFSLDG